MKCKRVGVVLLATLVSVGMLTGCARKDGESPSPEPKEVSAKSEWNYAEYVSLGEYEEIAIVEDFIDVYVGDVLVSLPYSDETYMTECTLLYYYSQMSPETAEENWVDPTDDEVAQMGHPEVTTFRELKNYVSGKVNENAEIVSFMRIGDALMAQVAEASVYKEIPEAVIEDCESIYSDYLSEMKARYNEIGESFPAVETENRVRKVLAAMAIAQDAGLDQEEFNYREVLEYLIEHNHAK